MCCWHRIKPSLFRLNLIDFTINPKNRIKYMHTKKDTILYLYELFQLHFGEKIQTNNRKKMQLNVVQIQINFERSKNNFVFVLRPNQNERYTKTIQTNICYFMLVIHNNKSNSRNFFFSLMSSFHRRIYIDKH